MYIERLNEKTCRLTRFSELSGKGFAMVLPADWKMVKDWIENRQSRGLVQDVFPDLSSEQREFILTGITPEEWNNLNMEEE